MASKPVSIVADPTLLADYDPLMKKRSLPFPDYILIYSLSSDSRANQGKIVSAIKERVGPLPVVSVVANSCPVKHPGADHHIYDASPQEWVWLIANAKFVYTDSFHGALFCVKYETPFVADYKEEWRSLRLLDAAEHYGFLEHVGSGTDDTVGKINDSKFDFMKVKERINRHIDESKEFLERSLCL
jgi:hypothetical protein